MLPGSSLGFELLLGGDAPVEALAAQDRKLDFDHVEPAGVLGGVVEFQASQTASCFGGRECLVEGGGGVGWEIVLHDADVLHVWIVQIDEVAHALGVIFCCSALRHLDLAPGSMHVEDDEQIGGSLALVFAVIPFKPAGSGRHWLPDLADELGGALVETDHRARRIGLLGIEVEHVLHAGDVIGIDLRNAPHVLAPRLEVIFGQTPAHRLAGDTIVLGELDQFTGQQLQCPTAAACRWLGTGGGDEQGLLLAREFAARSRARFFAERRFQVPSTKRRLVRYTVDPPAPTLLAISSSLAPASAASKICARLRRRAACLPPFSSAVSCSRSVWLSSTR